MELPKRKLNIPRRESQKFEKNFIKQAVCELKYPIILDLEPPIKLQKSLRREYPLYEKMRDINVDITEMETKNTFHYKISSANHKWNIVVKQDAITLETSDYITFEDFVEKLAVVVSKAKEYIDSSFFNRVGLRYINLIPFPNDEFKGFINPELVKPLEDFEFGTVISYGTVIQGHLEEGQYIFRHGIMPITDDSNKIPEYYLDFDYFQTNVEVDETIELVKSFHEHNFSFFYWCLGEKSIKALGNPSKKEIK